MGISVRWGGRFTISAKWYKEMMMMMRMRIDYDAADLFIFGLGK